MNKLVTLRFAKISTKLEEISEVQKLEVISTPESTDEHTDTIHTIQTDTYSYALKYIHHTYTYAFKYIHIHTVCKSDFSLLGKCICVCIVCILYVFLFTYFNPYVHVLYVCACMLYV